MKSNLKISLSDYWEMCREHNWAYSSSTDHTIYNQGFENQKRLADIACQSEEHTKIFHDFYKYHYDFEENLPEKPKNRENC